ncbi:MAG: hypothetical protein E4G94_00775 [ANME-2 cluster archaeon]|nr:MAG: hypothetical protein E4G94_00775 [ANME-2 cluster archaeon]
MKRQMRNAENAQSEVIGYSLLLGVLVTAVGIIIVLAAPIIQESKNDAYLKNVEQGFTVLDSKISMVGLGNSPSQLVQIYTQAGDIVIDDDTYSRISVIFYNGSDRYEVYNSSMGTVEYTLGQDKIAYEGGGTFRKYPGDDNVIMITPPEFHYNGETLTLPIIRINSNQSIGGSGVVNLYFQSNNTPNVLFPNPDENPEFINPLLKGKQVYVVIKSDYYKAWAKYIEERTDASVVTNDAAKEVRVNLNARPSEHLQKLEMPIDVFGFNVENESAMQNLSMVIANGTSNFRMTMTTSPSKTEPYFTVITDKSGGIGPLGVRIDLHYYDQGKHESWYWDVQSLKVGSDFNIDFLDNDNTIEYGSPSNMDSWTWGDENICEGIYYNGASFTCGGRKIFQHYMSIVGPTFSFSAVKDQPSDWAGFNESSSSYGLYYEVMPPVITYLHIVEHKIQANLA